MTNLKKSFTSIALVAILGFGSIAANAGIIITDIKSDGTVPCSKETEKSLIGIIITDLVGIIITDFTGIIITDLKTEESPVNCGIIITD